MGRGRGKAPPPAHTEHRQAEPGGNHHPQGASVRNTLVFLLEQDNAIKLNQLHALGFVSRLSQAVKFHQHAFSCFTSRLVSLESLSVFVI